MLEVKKNGLFDINDILSKIGIGEKQHVAELGCGNFGFFVFPMARRVGRQGKVYAVDILKSTLEEIRREAKSNNIPQIVPVWSNLEKFKAANIESNSLDSALLVNVLHQSQKKADILREAIRLLKRGGRLAVIEWKDIDLPLGPKPDQRVKLESLKAAIPKIGLDISQEFEAGPYHYGLILIKL